MKDFKSGIELFARVKLIAEEEKHHPDLHLTGHNRAAIEMSSHSLGGSPGRLFTILSLSPLATLNNFLSQHFLSSNDMTFKYGTAVKASITAACSDTCQMKQQESLLQLYPDISSCTLN